MSIRTGKLTVFFEEPFWVGIFERVENGKLSVSKVTFGTEPKDYEIWEFVLKEYDRLQFSPSVEVTEKELTKNPKKLQREIHKQMLDRGAGTKSQQALKLQQEQRKQQRKSKSREDKLAEEKKMFDLKQKKKKEKNYLQFVLEQLSELDEITYRTMMGEFIIYYRGKIIGGIYDDRLLVKPTKSAIAYMTDPVYEVPYEGAKEMLLVEEVDQKEFLTGLFHAMYDELPLPKPKKKK